MTIKNIIGWFLMVLPLILLFSLMVWQSDIKVALFVFGVAALVFACCAVGSYLILS